MSSPIMIRSWTTPEQCSANTDPMKKAIVSSRPLRTWCISAITTLKLPLIRGRILPNATYRSSCNLQAQQMSSLSMQDEIKPRSGLPPATKILVRSHTVSAKINNMPTNKHPSKPPTRTATLSSFEEPSPSTAGLGQLFRKLTRNSSLRQSHTCASISLPESKSAQGWPFWLQHSKQCIEIYLNASFVVAGGQLTGTLVVQLHPSITSLDSLENLISLNLTLHGMEAITDASHFSAKSHTFQFLDQSVLEIQSKDIHPQYFNPKIQSLCIPFTTQLPIHLSGSYKDKKACLRYYLESELLVSKDVADPSSLFTFKTERPIEVYSNAVLASLGDAALYLPVIESKHIWKAAECQESFLSIDLVLDKSIWVAGSPIYAILKTSNMSKQKIHNIKLELLRRQNTFSQMAMSDSFTYMPVTSTCKVIAQSSLANFDWWKAVDEGMRSQVTIAIEVPANQYSIKDQTLLNVSFALRFSLSSDTTTECVFETPITLFHQISIDPPPNIYVHKINPVEGIEANLFLQKAQEQRHQRASVLSSSYETFSSDSMETSTESLGKSISDKKNSLTKALRGILQSHRPNSQKSPLAATSLPALLSPTSSTVEYVQMNEVEARKTVGPPESIDASVAGFRQQLGMHMAEEAMQGYIAEVCSTTETEGSLSSTESTTFHDLYQQNSASSSEWHRKENPRALKRMMASSSRYMRSFRSKSMYFQQLNALDTEKGQKC